MASLQSLLRRRPEVDEAELELVRTKTLSRLTALSNGDPGLPEELPEEPTEAQDGETPPADAVLALGAPAAEADPTPDDDALAADDGETRPALVGVMAEPTGASWNHVAWVVDEAGTGEGSTGDPELAGLVASTTGAAGKKRAAVSSIWDAATTPAVAKPGGRSNRTPPPRPVKAVRSATAVVASCPYCALLLEPPPEATRRCTRCRQRIIVKRVDGRAVYLTEASLLVFSAQRRRAVNVGRWTRDRERWLKGAIGAGASEARITRLSAAPLTEDSVKAAQNLYMTTVEKNFRLAKRDHRWEDASRIKRDQAQLLFRFAGSPTPPPDDFVHLYREAATAALRGIGEMAKDAELVHGASCCGVCRADAGRAFRITHELRVPRLPHAGCPRGLCKCDWDLAIRDRDMVRRYLRRRPRAEQALVEQALAEEGLSADDITEGATL